MDPGGPRPCLNPPLVFAARTSPECWQSSDARPHGSLWGRHSRSSVIGKNFGGRSLRASWREDLAKGPRARMDAGQEPSAQQDGLLGSTLPCSLRASFLASFSPPGQFSFSRRPVRAPVGISALPPAQHPAGLSLLVPEGEQGEQLSALPAASLPAAICLPCSRTFRGSLRTPRTR